MENSDQDDKLRKTQGIVESIKIDESNIITGQIMRDKMIDEYFNITNPKNTINHPKTSWPLDFLISTDEVISAMMKIPTNKAITEDCVPDTIFKLCCNYEMYLQCHTDVKKIVLAEQCFTENFWAHPSSLIHLRGRIIPLNKAYPDIPKIDQIRFIVAISPVQKLLEASLLPSLQQYAHDNLKEKQRAYIGGCSTHSNIADMLAKSNKGKDILFIDYSKAFDTVDRHILYSIIQAKDILSPVQLKMLQFIHSNSSVSMAGKSIQTSAGVPQGSLVSPLLFNIFIHELLDMLSSHGLTRAFAHDVAIAIEKNTKTEFVIEEVSKWSTNNRMSLNKDKSGIISNILKEGTNVNGIKVCEKYKYLGVFICKNLSVQPHLKHLRKSLYSKCLRLRKLLSGASIKFKAIIFKVLIDPIITYARPASLNSQTKTASAHLQAIRRKCIRLIMGLGMNTKNTTVEALTHAKNTLTEDIIELINLFNRSICKTCRSRISSSHLSTAHQICIQYSDVVKSISDTNSKNISKMLTTIESFL